MLSTDRNEKYTHLLFVVVINSYVCYTIDPVAVGKCAVTTLQWICSVLHLFIKLQPRASSTLQLSQLGNRFSIFNINPKAFSRPIYQSFPHTGMFWLERSYRSRNLPSKSNWTQEWIDPVLPSWLLSIVADEIKLDEVKVIPTVRGYLLRRGNQQNLFSITAAAEEKMDLMHIDRYWFGHFQRTNKMVLQLFNCFYLPQSNVWAPGGVSGTLWAQINLPDSV